jgi:hypothetical protein
MSHDARGDLGSGIRVVMRPLILSWHVGFNLYLLDRYLR